LTRLPPGEQLNELRDSKAQLEETLQRPVDTVAYPFGRATLDTVLAAREAGYRGACRTAGAGSWEEPLTIPRQDMSNYSTRLGLALKRRDLYEPLTATLPGRALRRGSRLLKTHLRPWAERTRRAPRAQDPHVA
jgi:peptidoglycan/xylan/chitin deacetylase (PgdA/CDA1 family)